MEYLSYPVIDPVVFTFGPLTGNWYGLFFEIGLLISSVLLTRRLKGVHPSIDSDRKTILIFTCFITLLLGARVSYVLLYCPSSLADEPFYFLKFWDGCASFAGAVAVVVPVLWLLSKKWNVEFYRLADVVVTTAPVASLAVLAGDAVVGSGWGKVVMDSHLSMLFSSSRHADMLAASGDPALANVIKSNAYGVLPRFPSQLLELVSQVVLWLVISLIYSKNGHKPGFTTAFYLLLFSLVKIATEQFHEMDMPVGFSGSLFSTKAGALTIPLLFMFEIIVLSVLVSKKNVPKN